VGLPLEEGRHAAWHGRCGVGGPWAATGASVATDARAGGDHARAVAPTHRRARIEEVLHAG
jgi:hypothetical protein